MHARENQIETTNGKLKFFFPFKKKVGNGIYFQENILIPELIFFVVAEFWYE